MEFRVAKRPPKRTLEETQADAALMEAVDGLAEAERIILPNIEEATPTEMAEARDLVKGVTEPRKQAFIFALTATGSRSRACRATKVGYNTVWQWNRDDPAFAKAYVKAMEIASDRIEDEAIRRATEGVIEPVFQAGKLVGSVRRFSDHLLTVVLKGAKPEKYADKHKVDVSVDVADRLIKARERAFGRAPAELEE